MTTKLEDRARALEPLGFTPRQARFLATVALHGGYCLRRQYVASAGVCYGKNVCDFLDALVDRHFAERFTIRADRGHLYHLRSRTVYRLLRQEHNRNRRPVSAALIARKVMVLDYVLAHPDVEWAATEEDKVALFADHFGVPLTDLPQRIYPASRSGGDSTTRFFPHKLPIAAVGDPAVVHIVYLATELDGRSFEGFLHDHAALLARLGAWTVTVVAPPTVAALALCEQTFAHFIARPTADLVRRSEELQWYFATRQTVDAGALARLSVTDINRFRTLRDRFRGPKFEALYRDWAAHPDEVLGAESLSTAPPPRRVGTLVTEVLPFDYSQFGSLPGVA